MPQDFYDLNRPTPAPAGRPNGPHHGHPTGPHGGHAQGYQQGHPAPMQGLPRHMNSANLGRGPAIQISDVSRELLTESDMREELTDYMVVRFEKVVDREGFDEQGQPKRPSWERVIRAEEHGISKHVAAKKVQQLNRSTKGVLDKKDSLPPPLRLQIDRTLEYLMDGEQDPGHFHWVLAQMDHQLRQVEPYYYYNGLNQHYYAPVRKHRSSSHRLSSSSKRRSYGESSSHHHKKKKKHKSYERLSLTAYFQRVPLPNINITSLWNARRGAERGNYPQMPPGNHQHQGQQHGNPQGAHQHPQGRGPPGGQQPGARPPGPPPGHPSGGHQPGHHQPPPPPPQNRPGGGPAPRAPNGGQGQWANQRRGDVRARHSDSDSDSGSDSGFSRGSRRGGTPPSSVSDHHKRGRPPGPRPSGNLPGAAYRPSGGTAGGPRILRPTRSPHGPGRAPVAPPYPVSRDSGDTYPSTIERIREHAYQRGVKDTAENLGPRRTVYRSYSDADDKINRYFARMALYDDDEQLRREDRADREEARRRREYESRAQRGSVFSGDPFGGSTSSSSYDAYSTDGRGRSRGSPPIIGIPGRHPLSPRLPRGRSYY
ncbi:hypothetical protein F5Y10DRAFT_63809 [Nemania abortiva]|nr:hypothetical protein F5Y10DRAFT_63809 [Nemania abortiva]